MRPSTTYEHACKLSPIQRLCVDLIILTSYLIADQFSDTASQHSLDWPQGCPITGSKPRRERHSSNLTMLQKYRPRTLRNQVYQPARYPFNSKPLGRLGVTMESFESLGSLGEQLPEMPGHPSLAQTEDSNAIKRRLSIEKLIADNPDNEPAQIDAIAKASGYFMGCGRAVDIVDSYVNGRLDLQEAVRQIAEPIEHAYTTANGGRLFVAEEEVARNQRSFHSPDTALSMWGPEEDLEELQARVTDNEDAPTVEGELWDLYYTILHAAKKTPWSDVSGQQKLVDLLAALKARPNPEFPANMTIALKRNWIYEWGRLWSDMVLFGPSARETWNDSPGCGAGWYPPEVSAWVNVNAFVARLTAQEVRHFGLYGFWALRGALDEKIKVNPHTHHPAPSNVRMAEHFFAVAAVWIRLAGPYMFDNISQEDESGKDRNFGVWTQSQWNRWQQKFADEANLARYSETTTTTARECAEIMSKISAGSNRLG